MKERDIIDRILDANANRCAEGLRVVEELARFSLGDDELFRELKDLRHRVRRVTAGLLPVPQDSRDSEGDPGAAFSSAAEMRRPSLVSICRANLMRAQEALRVLEEFTKLVDLPASSGYKEMRFRLYTLEKRLLGGAVPSPMPARPFLYAFIDRKYIGPGESGPAARKLAGGGADMIQYRAKGVGRGEMLADLSAVIAAASTHGIPVVVNDDPQLAVDSGADGAHIGRSDGDPQRARRILGADRILGVTVHSPGELGAAVEAGADYVGVGSVFPTKTKDDVRAVGTELIEEIASMTSLPVVGIGGIDAGNIEEVLDAGAAGAAVISAILEGDIGKNCFTLKRIIDRRR